MSLRENNAQDIPTARGTIGLWGVIVVRCPYCGVMHRHEHTAPDATVKAPCGQGEYRLDCQLPRCIDTLPATTSKHG